MLSGWGISSHDEKSNKQSTSQIRPMQALVNTDFKTRKPERLQEWTFSQIYTCRQKSRRNVPANQPPNSNPLLQIPKSNQCIPVRHLVVMYNSVAAARMLHRVLRLSTGIYHNYFPLHEIRPEFTNRT